MPTQAKSRVRPLDGAVQRIVALAGRSAPTSRMAREVELIVGGWEQELGGDVDAVKERVQELHEALAGGVTDAEEQVSDVDRADAGAARQAQATLSALMACRDTAGRWLERVG